MELVTYTSKSSPSELNRNCCSNIYGCNFKYPKRKSRNGLSIPSGELRVFRKQGRNVARVAEKETVIFLAAVKTESYTRERRGQNVYISKIICDDVGMVKTRSKNQVLPKKNLIQNQPTERLMTYQTTYHFKEKHDHTNPDHNTSQIKIWAEETELLRFFAESAAPQILESIKKTLTSSRQNPKV